MTRIVAGAFRGRRLATVAGPTTRPSADRLRQSLFDMLAHAPWAIGVLDDAYVLDLFAGTGALAFEALSRGAHQAELVENDAAALRCLRRNVATLDVEDRVRIVAADATAKRIGPPVDLVLLDPPYGRGLVGPACRALAASSRVTSKTLFVAEVGAGEAAPLPGVLENRRFGAARILAWRGPAVGEASSG